ncbi:Lipopolysaccharide-induced TNF-alpha factor [Fasciola gigantica]|uniref:Lipopolysaccharide-induced TNF-alpha factor n=1 Tax=Fasciola gigantica TaxID=46835 RepID=A0A504YIM3_FASGI|nr:Lipopolysaccharide-induced TNF-alpha factor [Fasciola gigantica]
MNPVTGSSNIGHDVQVPPYPPMNAPPPYSESAAYPQYNTAEIYPPPFPVVQQPTVCTQVVTFGPVPTAAYCTHCNQQVVTEVHYVTGALTWLLCAIIFFFTGPLFCFLIPFCVDDCKDAVHNCPRCNMTLGTYRRL